MDTAPPTDSIPGPPTLAAGAGPPLIGQQSISVSPPPAQTLSSVSTVWPRSAQLATAFLLGLAVALIGIQVWSLSRWSTRPLEINRNQATQYRIDLNQAHREQLLQVPGIGDRTAEKIESYRQEHGPFRSKEELTHIRGIGPAKLEKMGNWLTVQSEEVNAVSDASPVASQPKRFVASNSKSSTTRTPSKKEESIKEPIDVNQADLEELQRLPGIGPKLAQRILDERAKSPFRAVDDLRRVSGIGPKILERLRPFVKVQATPNRLALHPDGNQQNK